MIGIGISSAASRIAFRAVRATLLAAATALASVPALAQSGGPIAGVTKFDYEMVHSTSTVIGSTIKAHEYVNTQIALQCPKGWVASGNGCRYCYECNVGKPPQTGQPRAPAKSVPAPCSADLVARYLAEVTRQPPARRPAPGSAVALTENGKACVLQMPTAAVAPPPQQRVIVGTQTVDGQTYTFIRIEPVMALPPSGNYNQFVPAFGTWAAAVGRNVEDHLFVHPVLGGTDGVPAMATSPYITDGVINAAEASARLSHASMEAGANWAKNNPGVIAGMAVAIMVSAVMPAAPIAAWVLGGNETAAVGTLADAVIGGMIYSGTEASVRSMVNDFGSNKSAGQQFMNALGSGGAAALGSIPGSIVGGNVNTLLGPFVAQTTASALGWAAGAGVDKAVDALGLTTAAQTVLTGGFDGSAPQPGGTVLRAASLSPRPGFK